MLDATLTGYSIREILFESTRSLIYRAVRTSDDRPVVLKTLNAEYPALEQLARLRREFRMTREAQVEGVVQVLGLERYRTSLTIVMEDTGAQSLKQIVTAEPFELGRVLHIAVQLAGAIGRVHQRRIIHKDINPSNILYNPRTGLVQLIDFGISTALLRETPGHVGPRMLEGTLPYISPEQTGRMNRAVDYRADLYSLGVTLYQLATGRLPFTSSDPMSLVHGHIAQIPAPPHEVHPTLPPVVSDIISRLLAKRAEDRYQSAFALQADLERCAADLARTGQVAPFPIGQRDVSEVFRLPQKLYGRENELGVLLRAFERAANGDKAMMLVAGYSGIGKSALVQEVQKSIVERRGYFISGKFDQLNRNIPYASLIQAVQELVRQLLTESEEQLSQWREKILAATAPNAQVIIDVIPEVQLVLGAQPPVSELPPKEAQYRFNLTFERFLRVFADKSHPLTIFLDDLQWADLPSLLLIELFMTDTKTTHLLFVGAYRDNETDAGHPFLATVEAIRKAGADIDTVVLAALDREQCVELLADALHCDPSEAGPLAHICIEKTGGNPFFLGQFLLSLYERGELRFDERANRWTWDDQRLRQMEMTDNVVDLMGGKIRGLPESAQLALRLAACIGNVFDLRTLAVVMNQPPDEAAATLWPGLKEGLVLPIGDAYKLVEDEFAGLELLGEDASPLRQHLSRVSYRFLHDRVQQAAYSLVPEAQRRELHLRIGRLLLRNASPREREEDVFSIVGHLNLGADSITRPEEREELAALNLSAGLKARSSAAYSAALAHFEKGIELLGPEGFQRSRDVALELHLNAAEASYLNKAFDRIDEYARRVLAHDESILAQVKIAEIRIQAFNSQTRLPEAIRTALDILKSLGLEFPDKPAPEDLAAGIRELDSRLVGRSIASLIDLPPMTEPIKIAVMRILAMMIPATYLGDTALFPLIALRQVIFAIDHGNAGSSASSFAAWGIIACGALGRIDEGCEFGELSRKVLARYDARNHECRSEYIISCFIAHNKLQVRQNMQAFRDTHLKGLETGDIDFASYSLVTQTAQFYASGTELEEVDQLAASNVQTLAQLCHDPCMNYTKYLHQAVQNLRGLSSDPCRLEGAVCNEERLLAEHVVTNDTYGISSSALWKLQLCYLFGRYEDGLKHARTVRAYMDGLVGQFAAWLFVMSESLVLLACHPSAPPEQQEQFLARVTSNLAQLKAMADSTPMNHAHRYWLVEAERARLLGATERAREAYYRAMEFARQYEFRNDEALATERFALFCWERGEREVSELFLAKARHLYVLWGAKAKVNELEQKYPQLAAGRRSAATGPTTKTATLDEYSTPGNSLDLPSVLKASQTLSGEVVLSELLRKMMHIVLENAGASRGFLILEGHHSLIVEGVRTSGAEEIRLQEGSVEQRDDLSQAIVRYVHRKLESVILEDSAGLHSFQSDPYLLRCQPRSILCLPILRQKVLVAVLYLENELVANAFTPEHCQVLELLSSQMAISLENARLYETLDSRVKEKTWELSRNNEELSQAYENLRKTQRQLITQEKLASLGMLTSGIAHELKNPLNFITNFAHLTSELSDELGEQLRGQRERLVPGSLGSIQGLLTDIQQNVLLINTHGKRADSIIRSMLEHTRADGGDKREVNLNELVRSYTQMAFQGLNAQNPRSSWRIELDCDPDMKPIHLVPQDIGRVILNLVNNACYEMNARQQRSDDGFVPQVRISTRDFGHRVEVRVRDNGRGIPAHLREKVFTPFFTTKPAGEGTGLGLSISHEIVVQGNGGTLVVESEEGAFTEFIIALPRPEALVT